MECLLVRQLPGPPQGSGSVLAPDKAGEGTEELRAGGSPGGETGADGSAWWEALMHPGQRLRPGTRTIFSRAGVQIHGEVVARHFHGRRTIRLWTDGGVNVADAIERIGHVPLPPYIRRDDRITDRERYQTVYARERGSIAAPTAGLHFTAGVLDALASKGVERTELTLHVGYGTFKPMRCERIRDHVVDSETYVVPGEAAAAITRARKEGRRVIAVGTTSMRALESLRSDEGGHIQPVASETELFIRPGHTFRVADGLITNFHLPRSSLLVLVAAFVGRERLLDAYREAIVLGYRFYSYGDAMAIL